MPDHEPFDGTVPYVVKLPSYQGIWPWCVALPDDTEFFATWREAMNYATKEDHR